MVYHLLPQPLFQDTPSLFTPSCMTLFYWATHLHMCVYVCKSWKLLYLSTIILLEVVSLYRLNPMPVEGRIDMFDEEETTPHSKILIITGDPGTSQPCLWLWSREPATTLSTYYKNGLLKMALTLEPHWEDKSAKAEKAEVTGVEAGGYPKHWLHLPGETNAMTINISGTLFITCVATVKHLFSFYRLRSGDAS